MTGSAHGLNQGGVELRHVPATHPHAQALVQAYFDELARRLGGFEPANSTRAEPHDLSPPHGGFLVLYEDSQPVACGGWKTWQPGVAEIKRMFVLPAARGRGYARQLLSALERDAKRQGMHRIVLDTAAPLQEAALLYRSQGYRDIPAYNENPYASSWFEKTLYVTR